MGQGTDLVSRERLDWNRRVLGLLAFAGTVVWIVAMFVHASVWMYVYWGLVVATIVQLVRVHRADEAKAGNRTRE